MVKLIILHVGSCLFSAVVFVCYNIIKAIPYLPEYIFTVKVAKNQPL